MNEKWNYIVFVATHFWIPIQKKNCRKKKKYCSEKKTQECLENGKIFVEKVQRYKAWNLTVYFFTDESPIYKENSIWERKIQNQMFKDLIIFFFQRLIKFMKGLIARKIDF